MHSTVLWGKRETNWKPRKQSMSRLSLKEYFFVSILTFSFLLHDGQGKWLCLPSLKHDSRDSFRLFCWHMLVSSLLITSITRIYRRSVCNEGKSAQCSDCSRRCALQRQHSSQPNGLTSEGTQIGRLITACGILIRANKQDGLVSWGSVF